MKQKKSIYLILSFIIVTTVIVVMSFNFLYTYNTTKEKIITNIKANSKTTILSLKENITGMMDSYLINEYTKIVLNEMDRSDILAIVIHDYNMGKIMGKESYISGKIRNDESIIKDYSASNEKQNKDLENSFYKENYDIVSKNQVIGKISIYFSDKEMNEELTSIIKENLRNTLIISVLLILVLFYFIKLFVLKPISDIIDVITVCDDDGIPIEKIPSNKTTKEFSLLTTTLNNMIDSIKTSRIILEKSENRLEYLLEMSPIAVRIAKNKGEDVIFANNAYSKLLRLNKKELLHKNPKDYYADKEVYEEIVKSLKENDSIYNKLVKLNIDNETVWALASYVNINFDGVDSIVGWFYDVTKEKETEKQLYEALELQSAIFDNSGYLLIRCDKNGIIKQINKEAVKVLGYEPKELIDIHTPEIIHLKSEVEQKAKEFSKELDMKVDVGFETFVIKSNLSKENEHEWTYITKDGKNIPVLLSVSALRDKENNIYGYFGIAKDITQRKVIESQAKLASMGEMIGNIAHQWRQPLNVISTIASGIKLKNEFIELKIDDILPDMENILKQTKYLSDTIDDFRDFIKNSNKKERISIKETIEKTLSIFHSAMKNNNITIVSNIKDDFYIDGFQNQLIQAIINILNNSKDAFNDNEIKERFIFIESQNVLNKQIITIKDNAGGIKDEIIHKIFEPYFTTKHKSIGTGLGLSMVHQIVTKHHNATIEVENETYEYEQNKYVGACFKIEFEK